MPTDGLSVALAILGALLVGGGLWGILRFKVHVRTGAGRSITVCMELAATRSGESDDEEAPIPTESVADDVVRR